MKAFVCLLAFAAVASAAPEFSLSSARVPVFDYVEVTVRTKPAAGNPFVDTELIGELRDAAGTSVTVHGFCDSADGATHRIRFLATKPGEYTYKLSFRSPAEQGTSSGRFTAEPSKRRGRLRVDPQHPAHFLWEGTGEHYFWNGLTTYAIAGWRDDSYIDAIIDRAARLKVNRLRATLVGPRVADASRWYEPVGPSDKFRFLFGPWLAKNPDNVADPSWDVTRFDVAFWQKYERMVRHAREREVIISVIFFLDGADKGADPFGKAGGMSDSERQYYRYAAARLGAFTNVTWDITNEWHLFRDAWWVERIANYLKTVDPFDHLASCHGKGDFPWMLSKWADFALFQIWDEEGDYEQMLKRRRVQAQTGRLIPQINEEYGYEDHYPVKWGGNKRSPARSADNRRRMAWRISMAGTYQTTGERANRGDGNPPATPGGWINGGFDDSMKMLDGYARMVDFFTSFDYWKLEPSPEAVKGNVLLLAEPGKRYVIYYPQGGSGAVDLAGGTYRTRWYNPRSGEWRNGPDVTAPQSKTQWNVPAAADQDDWALLLERK